MLPKASHFYGTKADFSAQFPSIATIKIKVRFRGGGELTYGTPELGHWVDCNRPFCDRGGFLIDPALGEMVAERKTHHEALAACQGMERHPGKGRRAAGIRGPCTQTSELIIDVTYRTPA